MQDKEFILSLYQKILKNNSPFVQLKKMKALLKKQNHIEDSIRIFVAKIALKAGMLGESRFQLQQQNNRKNPITYLLMAKLDREEGVPQDSYWLNQIESCLDDDSLKKCL